MPYRMHSVWISHKLTPVLGINLDGFEADRAGLRAEIEAVEAILSTQERGSLLVIVDMALTDMGPELIAFLNAHAGQAGDPIRKMAIVGISAPKRIWYRLSKKVSWPKHARFFDGHEPAKAWLITEGF